MFLVHINIFRAIAIVFIVAYHAISWFHWERNRTTAMILDEVFSNGTVLFVFIAGYLFCYLRENYGYVPYLRKKIRNVIGPYLVISIPAIAYGVFRDDLSARYIDLAGSSKLYQIAWLYVHGGVHINHALWFIPMISLYYVASPAFFQITRHPKLYWVLCLLIPLSLLVHRPPPPNLDIVHAAVYFLSPYMLGMLACQYRAKIERWLERHLTHLVTAYAVMLVAHLLYADHHGVYHAKSMFSFDDGYIDWLYLQKIIFCFVLIGVLKKWGHLFSDNMHALSDMSYSIFLTHIYFMYAVKVLSNYRVFEGDLLSWAVFTVFILTSCTISVWLAQHAFGAHASVLIGARIRKHR